MRLIVMFDLPVLTYNERKEYRKFRKYLISTGFLMMQESVYCKLVQNQSTAQFVIDNIKKNKPESGSVLVLKVTEKQYSRMEYVIGSKKSEVLNNDERIIII